MGKLLTLTVKEAADLLGVKGASVRQLERRGKLRAVRDWNGHRLFSDKDVQRLKDQLIKGLDYSL